MIINSNFHDFYDGSHGGFIDKTIVYERYLIDTKIKEIEGLNHRDLEIKGTVGYSYKDLSEIKQFFYVGYCGKIYIGFKYYKTIKLQYNVDTVETFTYDRDLIFKILIDHEFRYLKSKKSWEKEVKVDLDNLYQKYEGKELLDPFIKYKSPLFIIGTKFTIDPDKFDRSKNLILNPSLKNISFFKFEAPIVFRDISTFISNVLTNPEKESPPLSNVQKIEAHGFDKTTSFRKPKEK